MKRDQLQAIIGSLDTGTLIKMLQVAGIHVANPEDDSLSGLAMGQEQGGSQMEPWNTQKVNVAETSRPPIHTRDFTVVQPKPVQRQIPGMNPGMGQEGAAPQQQGTLQNYIIGQ